MKYLKKILIALILILVIGIVTYFLIRAKPKPKPEEPTQNTTLNISITQDVCSGGYVPPSYFELKTIEDLNSNFKITLTIKNSDEKGVVYTHSHNSAEDETQNGYYCYCLFANDEISSPEVTGELVVGNTYTATLTLELEGKTFESNVLSFEFKSCTLHSFVWQLKTNP